MKKPITIIPLILVTLLPLSASDWSQWRGPNRDGVSTEKGLLREWPAGGPPLVWKATRLGAGHAGIAVAGGKVFTMGEKEDASFVVALNEADGKEIWRTKIGKPGGGPPGPRGTPTVDGDRVYVLGQFGDLVCLKTGTGEEVWRKQLEQDFGGKCGGWNYTESPLVDRDRVICTPGSSRGSMVALSKTAGQLLWQTKEITDAAEYSSPITQQIDGVQQYIQLTAEHLFGVEAQTGKLLWQASRHGETATIPTPVFHDDQVYVTSGYGVGCNLFQINREGDEFTASQVYANKVMVNHHGGVVRIGEYLYGYSDGKGWVCQEFKTGKIVWSDKGVGKGSVTCADGHLYLRSEDGKGAIALVEVTPEGYREKGRFDQPERSKENSWPHPVIANGKLYIRDQELLFCFNVRGA